MNTYINSLKSTKPAPGGGSVAAVLTELSAALLHMACAISSQSPKTDEEKKAKLNVICERIDACLERGEALSLQDEEAYREVSRAFKKSTHTVEEAAQRNLTIQNACYKAALVPCEVIALAHEILILTSDVEGYINSSLLSDIAIAVALIQTAAKSALYLVHANLEYLDSENAQRVYKIASESYASLICESEQLQDKLDAKLLVTPSSKGDK